MSSSSSRLLLLLSSIVVLDFTYFIYHLWHSYDWGYPTLKAVSFAALFGLACFLRKAVPKRQNSPLFRKIEALVLIIVLIFTVSQLSRKYGRGLFRPPAVDVGTTTVKAASMLFLEGSNPYQSQVINPRPELALQYRGFHYGPFMMVGYLPAVYFTQMGFKVMSVLYFALSVLMIFLLIPQEGQPKADRWLACLFGLTIYVLPERFWFEILAQGANDIFPVLLLLITIVFLKKKWFLFAGLCAGLSFSAKFSPALFLIVLMVRQEFPWAFWKGLILGLFPIAIFLLWGPVALFNNMFHVPMNLMYDSTSLYSVFPPETHFLFPLILVAAIGWVVWRRFREHLDLNNFMFDFTFLMLVAEVTFRTMHTNHLIWFYPFFAVLLSKYRQNVFGARG